MVLHASLIIMFVASTKKGLFDAAILALQEKGDLEKLKKKWWEDEDNDEHCEV